MKWFLVLCLLLAVTNFVSSRPNKEHDEYVDDEDGGAYGGENEDSDEEEDEDNMNSLPPEIKSVSLTIEANLGDVVNLPCSTENAESFSILWKKNDVMIFQDKIQVGHRVDRYKRLMNQTLRIESVKENDTGEYECSIAYSEHLVAVKHILTVKYPARIVSATANLMKEISVKKGGIVELHCEATGFPAPKVSWSKNGNRLSAETRSVNESKVVIENVGKSDNGFYVCMADNQIRTPETKSVHVRVVYAPEVKVEKVIADDAEMHLICIVHAEPKAKINWYKNNKMIEYSLGNVKLEHKHDNDLTLKILKVEESDFGNYTCKATNEHGSPERHVIVSGVPVLPKFAGHEFVGENRDVSTSWIISSLTPISRVQLQYRKKEKGQVWSIAQVEFEKSPGYTHTVKHVLKDLETGVYETRLRSQNQYGWSDYTKAVSVAGKSDDPDSITKIEEGPMPVDEPNLAEPATGSGSRTILSWTVLSLIVLRTCSSFI